MVGAKPSEADEWTEEGLCNDPVGDAECSVTVRVGAREIMTNTSLHNPLVSSDALQFN